MGGKGIRRRAKNYKEAHGGYRRLPPPPDRSQPDALPSKLRKILSYTTPQGSLKVAKDAEQNNKKRDGAGAAPPKKDKEEVEVEDTSMENGDYDENMNVAPPHSEEKKKKKRKRKQVVDLRFEAEALEQSGGRLKRKERKKKYLEAKKNKSKKGKKEDNVDDFPGREKIRFGEVVQAPPKLVAPKAFKNVQDASKERVRVNAIEAYRQRKKWNSRPGIQLPNPVTASL
ncbi:PREDICTED: nucleolar protein 58 [Fragaria vesca subsp. vesca]|uniref:nucleolar protein 58 n=1 Tax=Fragaria vesca subsp. vesca TaxID=101020 RepID=UPI0002C3254E|nr:PREDICTED: nucleolar protein 58 [Fragaria vesca subsp. vesca]